MRHNEVKAKSGQRKSSIRYANIVSPHFDYSKKYCNYCKHLLIFKGVEQIIWKRPKKEVPNLELFKMPAQDEGEAKLNEIVMKL